MEWTLVGVIAFQSLTLIYVSFLSHKERKSLLNGIMAKTSQEFIKMEQTPKRKVRNPEPLQNDAGIPFGL